MRLFEIIVIIFGIYGAADRWYNECKEKTDVGLLTKGLWQYPRKGQRAELVIQ